MDKNKILKYNIYSGILWKGISLVFIYLTVPFLLQYLGKNYYGVWITIFTLLNTAYFLDIGISLGLKNKLTEALAKKDNILAKEYISTAYFSITGLMFIILLIGISFILNINLQKLFNTSIPEKELKFIIITSLVLVILSVVLNIYKSIYSAFHKSAKVEFAMMLYQIFIFFQIIILPKFFSKSLLLITLVYGITNIFIALIFSYFFFKKQKILFPSLNYFNKKTVKHLLGIGFDFFIIQLSLIIILSTDNLIITNLINPEATTTYSIIYKIFQPFLIVANLIFAPLWMLYTNAYYNGDFLWIKNTIRKLNYGYILMLFFIIILVLNFDKVLNLWIPEHLKFSTSLIYLMGLFIALRVYGDIYMTFLNGIGKIKLQKWLYVFGAIINIPLSIIFVKKYELGSSGVILATIISIIGISILMPIQAIITLKKRYQDYKEHK